MGITVLKTVYIKIHEICSLCVNIYVLNYFLWSCIWKLTTMFNIYHLRRVSEFHVHAWDWSTWKEFLWAMKHLCVDGFWFVLACGCLLVAAPLAEAASAEWHRLFSFQRQLDSPLWLCALFVSLIYLSIISPINRAQSQLCIFVLSLTVQGIWPSILFFSFSIFLASLSLLFLSKL